jgi:hypothetical protein
MLRRQARQKRDSVIRTMTGDLLGLCGWLKENEVEQVAMESEGSFGS